MPLILIQGKYKVLSTAPDGDSIRFYANNPELWKKLSTKVSPNNFGGVQLRLDAVDALETHFSPRGGSLGVQRQPQKYGDEAASELLTYLGFKDITRGRGEKITSVTPEEVPGFILTRFADTYGRAIAFVFKGEATQEDGGEVFLDKLLLKQSANYNLINGGLAYPTFYSKLYPDIRKELKKAGEKARKELKGLWSEDKTNTGFKLESLETITSDVVILPKLFRRLLGYLAINDDSVALDGFSAYLDSLDDKIIILPDGHVTGFDYVIKVTGQKIQMTQQPEDIVFIEK
jgi:endonuclease YncB( thermonuclease family)